MSGTTELVVVGVDGSSASDAALAWADRYANATGASLHLVSAWEWATAYGQPMMFDGYHPDSDALGVIEKARAALTVPAERVHTSATQGHAGYVLVKAAAEAGLLVVGTEGHRAVSSVLLGSVSTYCIHHATCPVVVVR